MSPVGVASSIVLTLVATTLPAAARTVPALPAEETGSREAALPNQDRHGSSSEAAEAQTEATPEKETPEVGSHVDVWSNSSARVPVSGNGLPGAAVAGSASTCPAPCGSFSGITAPAVEPGVQRHWLVCRFAHAPPSA